MKKLVAAAIAVASTIGAASAADLPSRKAPPAYVPPPPVLTWSGFYVGLNAGGTFGGNNNLLVVGTPGPCNPAFPGCASSPNQSQVNAIGGTFNAPASNGGGFIGGGQIGYNFQVSPAFVAGIEADIQGIAAGSGSSRAFTFSPNAAFPGSDDTLTAFSAKQKLTYLGTVRARLGFLATPTFLIYATGGLAYGGVKGSGAMIQATNADPGAVPVASAYNSSSTRVGYSVGGGVEWMFMPNWSLKAEYLYFDLGKSTYFLNPLMIGGPGSAAPGSIYGNNFSTVSARTNGHIARAGINYHFNWGGSAPVVARY